MPSVETIPRARPVRDNFMLADHFEWGRQHGGPRLRWWNALLGRLRFPWILQGRLDPSRDMTSLEQRINLWHLAEQVLACGIPGDFAEFGCFDGRTATLFGRLLVEGGGGRRLHLFDHFAVAFHLTGRDIEAELRENFRIAEAGRPTIHRGDFQETVPARLPGLVAFAHIDCGFGGDPEAHRRTVLHLLEHLLPRMAPGAIGVLMDYRHADRHEVAEYNPGTRRAADAFFAGRRETLTCLHAGEACHAFFRKAA